MISYIKTSNGHRESDNIFVLEYSIVNSNFQLRFDIDVSNYGNEIIGIKAKSDEDILLTDRAAAIDSQLEFVANSSFLSELGEILQFDNNKSSKEKIDYTTNYIDKFCAKWNLIHEKKEN